jgi:carbon monoxide dehydrogenase subunit G
VAALGAELASFALTQRTGGANVTIMSSTYATVSRSTTLWQTTRTRLAASAVAIVALSGLGATSRASAAEPIRVEVQQRGDVVVVDVDAPVDAPMAAVWDVLTDYNRMAAFLPSIKSSVVLARHDGRVDVEQRGEARHGFLVMKFHIVREIEEMPGYQMHSKLIRGDFKSYELTTKLVDQGGTTVIRQHGEYVPTMWIPPGVGPALIRSETEKGYTDLIAEVRRRVASASPATTAPAPTTAQQTTAPSPTP